MYPKTYSPQDPPLKPETSNPKGPDITLLVAEWLQLKLFGINVIPYKTERVHLFWGAYELRN